MSRDKTIQEERLANLTEKVELLDNKVDAFINNHFHTFAEKNIEEHGEIKEKLSGLRGEVKWIYLLFASLVIPLVLLLIK